MANNWAIVIGINQYEHLASERHLRFAVRDAEKMKEFLCDRAGFPPENVLLCTDKSPPVGHISTRPALTNLQRLLLEHIQHATEADNFWFFFAGHGMVGNDRQDYLLPCDGYPAYLKGSAIPTTFVTECLRNCQAKNIVLILDMCRREGMDSSRDAGTGVGEQTIEIAKQQGIITIFSCNRGQLSYEIPALQQGAFTYTLIQGLQQHSLLRQLEAYLNREVPIVSHKYGIQVQIPRIVAEPAGRYDLPLLSGYTTATDVKVLIKQAIQAELEAVTEEDYLKPKDLWWQVIDSSSSTQDQRSDARKAIEKLDEKIDRLRMASRTSADELKSITLYFSQPITSPDQPLPEPSPSPQKPISQPQPAPRKRIASPKPSPNQSRSSNNRRRSRPINWAPSSPQWTRQEFLKLIVSAGISVVGANIALSLWENSSPDLSTLSRTSEPIPETPPLDLSPSRISESTPETPEAGLTPEQPASESDTDQFPVSVNYSQLEEFLETGQWQKADSETAFLMLRVINRGQERWLDTESIGNFLCDVLSQIDQLWVQHSDRKFGFSVQKRIYLEDCGGKHDGQYDEKAWQCFRKAVGWLADNRTVSYSEITFDITSRRGHLPFGGTLVYLGGAFGYSLFSFVYFGYLLSCRDL
jgi:uncharacterized caspase-like protein